MPRAVPEVYREPSSGEGPVNAGTGPTKQAYYGDIPRTEKEALGFWSPRPQHSYALAPTPAVQEACDEDSASRVCLPRGEGGPAAGRLSSLAPGSSSSQCELVTLASQAACPKGKNVLAGGCQGLAKY